MYDPEDLKAQVTDFVTKNDFTPGTPLVGRLKNRRAALYSKLERLCARMNTSETLEERLTVGSLLRSWGFSTRKYVDTKTIERVLKEAIPEELVEEVFDSWRKGVPREKVNVRERILKIDPDGPAVYNAIRNTTRKDCNPVSAWIDRLWSEVRHNPDSDTTPSLYALLSGRMPEAYLLRVLRTRFYTQKDLMEAAITQQETQGPAIVSVIGSKARRHKRAYARQVALSTKIQGLRADHIASMDAPPKRVVGRVAEELVRLLGAIVLKYPDAAKSIPGADYLFPLPLQRVSFTSQGPDIHVSGCEKKIADLRFQGRNGSTLVEVKILHNGAKLYPNRIADQYDGLTRWADGSSINSRVHILLGTSSQLPSLSDRFRAKGWHVVTNAELTNLFNTGIDILKREDARVFQRLPYPTPADVYRHICDLVTTKPYLLWTSGHDHERNWALSALRQNSLALIKDIRTRGRRTYAQHTQTNFSDLPHASLDIPIPSEKNLMTIDLETTGFNPREDMITSIGIGHWTEQMYDVEQYLVRNPFEERDGLVWLAGHLETLAEASKEQDNPPTLVDFNGRFDVGWIKERMLVHRVRLPEGLYEIDLLPIYQKHARKHRIPSYRLQTFESMELGLGAMRADDIPGSRVPKIHAALMEGKNATLMGDVLRHNALDVATTALLYSWARSKGYDLKPRQIS